MFAQRKTKTISITLRLEQSSERVHFRSNGYLLVFNRTDLLENFEDFEYYDFVFRTINTHDTLDLAAVTQEITLHQRSHSYGSWNYFSQYVKECFDMGQVRVTTPKMKHLARIERLRNVRNQALFNSFSSYQNPLNGEKIFEYFIPHIGCPNF